MTDEAKPDRQTDHWMPIFGNPSGPWHRWFAWRPVWTVNYGWKWLRFIRRRLIHKHHYLDGPPDWWWQYRI